MRLDETGQVMDVLTVAYPQFYRRQGGEERAKALLLWAGMFEDEPVEVVVAAVKALIASKTDDWPPSIGAVKEHVRRLTSPPERSDAEAWDLAAKAVRRTDWNHPEVQFERLPPDVRAAVGSPHTLVEWGKVPEDTLASVISSHFRKTYRARQQAARELAVLPASVREMLREASGALALPEDGG